MSDGREGEEPVSQGGQGELRRDLGAWDAVLLTIGAVVGTGIFLTTSDISRALPHAGLLLLVWVTGGLLTLAGALTYAELSGLYPRAGGLYTILREAYGPLLGSLYGWACFLVVFSGGIAAIAVGFGEYLGSFIPGFAGDRELASLPLASGRWSMSISGAQCAGAIAILGLTMINHWGLRAGAAVQNLLTVLKVGAATAFAGLAFLAPARAAPDLLTPLHEGATAGTFGVIGAFGVGMIAAIWTYDGWYALTLSAGEMKRPERDLARGLVIGTVAVTVLYTVLNAAYLRALPLDALAATPRVAETAASALFGDWGGRLMAAAVLVSSFGCLAATILYCARLYLPMAEEGMFPRPLARVSARHRTPAASLWAQGVWSIVLALSGTYTALYTYVVFVGVLFHVAIGSALFVLRRRHPASPRPYRVWGYPWVPGMFVLVMLLVAANTLVEKPRESLIGLGLLVLALLGFLGRRVLALRAGHDVASS